MKQKNQSFTVFKAKGASSKHKKKLKTRINDAVTKNVNKYVCVEETLKHFVKTTNKNNFNNKIFPYDHAVAIAIFVWVSFK